MKKNYYNFPFNIGDFVICTNNINPSVYLSISLIVDIKTHEDLGRSMVDEITLEYKVPDGGTYYDIKRCTLHDIAYFKNNYRKLAFADLY